MIEHHLDTLESSLPAGRVLRTEAARRLRSRDWWPLARLREVRGDEIALPAAVLVPGDVDEVSRMLRWATETGTPIVPRGLGSGVVGGVTTTAASVVLELTAMNRIIEIDEHSATVRVEAGIRGDRLEASLNERGLTMGHLPQSLALSSPGGWVSAWSAGQTSSAHGVIEDRLVGLTAVLVDGTVVKIAPMPRATAGIDLKRIFLGAEGGLGVVTEVVLALAPLVKTTAWLAYRMPDFDACLESARAIRHGDIHPRFLRGWDEPDATRSFGELLGHNDGAVLVVGFGSDAPGLEGRQAAADAVAKERGAEPLDQDYGQTWWKHRLGAVDTFDQVMGPDRVLGPGSVLDTFEVTGRWADLSRIHGEVGDALRTESVSVGCHFSHVYTTGAALYFTFNLQASDDLEVEERYLRSWDAAIRACHSSSGSMAHHHGVGRLKAGHLATELGPGGTELMMRIKGALDPGALLNPGASASRLHEPGKASPA